MKAHVVVLLNFVSYIFKESYLGNIFLKGEKYVSTSKESI